MNAGFPFNLTITLAFASSGSEFCWCYLKIFLISFGNVEEIEPSTELFVEILF